MDMIVLLAFCFLLTSLLWRDYLGLLLRTGLDFGLAGTWRREQIPTGVSGDSFVFFRFILREVRSLWLI